MTTQPTVPLGPDGTRVMPVEPARPRRNSERLVVVIVILAVLAGLLIAADRFGVRIAEDRVASQLHQRLGGSTDPDVRIDGVPFLTQLIAGRFGRVEVAADDIELAGSNGPIPVDRLALELREVTMAAGGERISAGSLTGTADLGWEAVNAVADAAKPAPGRVLAFDSVDPQGRGRIRTEISTRVLGRSLIVRVVATPALGVDGTTIELTDAVLTVAGVTVPATIADRLLEQVLGTLPLELPYGLRATSLAVSERGATIGIAGDDVTFGG